MPKRQNAQTLKYQLPECYDAENAKNLNTKMPACKIVKLLKYQNVKMQNNRKDQNAQNAQMENWQQNKNIEISKCQHVEMQTCHTVKTHKY